MLSHQAFEQLQERAVDAIAIPIENTLAGAVVEHYDLLREQAVQIERETVVRIEHHVIGIPGSELDGIQRVFSHPVALAQCRSFFRDHPKAEAIPFYDTAGAVKETVAGRDRHAGAIAGRQAAAIYGGIILAEGVEDDPANFTRFLLVTAGTRGRVPEGVHKLSVAVELEHRPGALAALLAAVEQQQGNITKVQTRPVHGQPWRYYYFLDVLLPHAAASQRLLEQLPALCRAHKSLGRYPAAPQFADARPVG